MSLESFYNNVDIRALSLEKPDEIATPSIDVERLIDDNEWHKLNVRIESHVANKEWSEAVHLAAAMKQISTDRPIVDLNLKRISRDFVGDLKDLVVLFPEFRRSRRAKGALENSKTRLESYRQKNDWIKYLSEGVRLKWHDPNNLFYLFPLWDKLEEEIKESINKVRDSGSLNEYVNVLANLKLLYPEFYESLAIDPQVFIRQRQNEIHFFDSHGVYLGAVSLSFCRDLKILAAEKAKITYDGLQTDVSKPSINHDDSSKLPQRRKF